MGRCSRCHGTIGPFVVDSRDELRCSDCNTIFDKKTGVALLTTGDLVSFANGRSVRFGVLLHIGSMTVNDHLQGDDNSVWAAWADDEATALDRFKRIPVSEALSVAFGHGRGTNELLTPGHHDFLINFVDRFLLVEIKSSVDNKQDRFDMIIEGL